MVKGARRSRIACPIQEEKEHKVRKVGLTSFSTQSSRTGRNLGMQGSPGCTRKRGFCGNVRTDETQLVTELNVTSCWEKDQTSEPDGGARRGREENDREKGKGEKEG